MKCFTHPLCLIFSFIILNFSIGFGQEIEWQHTIGGNQTDRCELIKETPDGGFILGGNSLSGISGNKTSPHNGNINVEDFWIVKLDSAGNVQWQKNIGAYDQDYFTSLDLTTDGGYILCGYSSSSQNYDKTEGSMGGYDYWILKLSGNGTIQWQNTIGGNDWDKAFSIKQTLDGGYIMGGSSNSLISGDKTAVCKGIEDYWLIKLNAIGNIQWQNTYGGDSSDILYSLQQTFDGGYILGGISQSNISGDKSENTIGTSNSEDYWIVKVDSTGNIQWQNTIGGNRYDILGTIRQTTDGGYIVGGSSRSDVSGDKTENSDGGSNDYWILKLDTVGNIIWQNTIGGDNWDYFGDIQQTDDGGFFLGGSSGSKISMDKNEDSNYIMDYWVLKLNSLGLIEWQNSIGGDLTDGLRSIQQTSSGDYILAGYSNSLIGKDKTETNFGLVVASTDFWIVKLNNNYNLITGNVFIDQNSNGIKEISEQYFANNKITEQNTNRFAFSQLNGDYNIAVCDSGNFVVTSNFISYYNSAPSINNINFSGTQQIDSLNDFAFQPTGAFNDLCITITPLGPFRSGFNASYLISYENLGTTSINGDVIFFPFSNVTYLSSNVIPASITPDSVVWTTGVLTPFQTASIVVTVNVNVGLPFGTLINSSVRIEPVAGDANPGCNYHSWEVYTIESYDPNDIIVSEDTLLTTQFPNPPYLDYIIRFQNTGNDTAFTVKILNPIDTNNLELSSIEFVNSSHPVNLNWIPWERNMEFKFNNILLPDSIVNEPLSHGFVHYRIKPKTTLLAGDSIANNAYIYFDFNMPVATNTAVTKIVLPTGINNLQFTNSDLKVFPNPAKDEITITGYSLQNNQPTQLKIFDVMGKQVLSQSIANLNSQIINLKSFASGVYFVQLQSGAKIRRAKFVKQ